MTVPQRQEDWTYHDYVRAWQEIDSRSAWLKGDLAAGVETTYGEQTLQRYAGDVGASYETLMEYRRVAWAFPQNSRVLGIAYGVYQALAAQADRLELIASRDDWTVAAARELVSSRRQPRLQPVPPSQSIAQPPAPAPAPQPVFQPPAPSYQQPVQWQPPAQNFQPQPVPAPNPVPQQLVVPNPAPPMLTLYTADGTPVQYKQPQGRAVFNETKGEGISWAA